MPLFALDPSQKVSQYAHSVWSRENGLGAGIIALTQTPDGVLWVGTEAGLQRFDGVRFRTWQAPADQHISGEYITALTPDGDTGLWIGTREGLSNWNGNQVRNYQTGSGASRPVVMDVVVDRSGTVWVGTASYRTGGLCRVAGNALDCKSEGRTLPGFAVAKLLADSDGILWLGGYGICRWKPGTSLACPFRNPDEMIHAIARDRQGRVWVAADSLKVAEDNRFSEYPLPRSDTKLRIKALLFDRDGGLWIGTYGQGLLRLHEGRVDRFTQADGLSSADVRCLFEDREGNIWVGTDAGLERFREYAVTRISKREGISESSVNAVFAARNGAMWVGSGGGLNLLSNGKTSVYSKRDGLPSDNIVGVFEERNGRVWASTPSGIAFSDGGRFHPMALPGAAKPTSIRSAAETRDGSVWLSDPANGLIRLRDAQLVEKVPWSMFSNKAAWALEADPAGDGLWLGFAHGEIAYFRTGQPVRWHAAGRQRDAVTDLHLAGDGSLWIASKGGLGRFHNERLDVFTTAQGLPCNGVRSLVQDDLGGLWLNTDCGLAAISAADLARWAAHPQAKVRVRVFDTADGMRRLPRATGYFRNAAKSNDGRIWFAATDGVAVVNPNRLPDNKIVPPVRIEEITAGENTYSGGSNLQLPPLTKELRISYTAMSFVAPEKVHFRYLLDGFDQDWKEDTGNRQAVYMNLPPARYKFRVIACNNSGLWNEQAATLDFGIRPAFYQTRVFEALCLLAAAALLWAGYKVRMRQMARRLSIRFETQLQERTRIAREMHDSLLQELSAISLELTGLSKAGDLSASLRERLQEVRRQSEKCTREAREFVWDLRAPVLHEVDLSQTLREAGEQITHGAAVSFHVTVQGEPRPAPMKLQQQLLRIVQEATRNAVRYSRAKEIVMDIVYLDSQKIRVQMRDDGCGFDPEEAATKSGHWGLRTMRERAEQVGGELRISSAPGRGTSIEIVVPIASAA